MGSDSLMRHAGGVSMQHTKGQESEEMQHYEAGPPITNKISDAIEKGLIA